MVGDTELVCEWEEIQKTVLTEVVIEQTELVKH